jgi:hypothetical protein
MTIRTWTRRLFARTPRTNRKEPARFRPRLEALEDRLAPATLTVTSAADPATPTPGTLRYALTTANTDANAGHSDTIQFSGVSKVTLSQGQLELSGHDASSPATITIDGGGAVNVDGNHASRVFLVDAGVQAAFANLTISNGSISGSGGGIYNSGTLTVSNCTLTGNFAAEDGINGGGGGGIANNSGALTVSNCTLAGNESKDGNAIKNVFGTLTVSNCTLAGNESIGAAIATDHGTLTVSNCTVVRNQGPGISSSKATVTINNTIVADNGAPDVSIFGAITGSHNLIQDGSGGLSDTLTGDPKLGPLADNGGSTQTIALLSGSPAIDAGDKSLIPNDPNTGKQYTTDQRGAGFNRVVGKSVDIGAFEVQTTDTTIALTASPSPSAYGQAVTLTAAVALTLGGAPATAGTVTFLDGSTVLQSGVSVNASGQATFSTANLPLGMHTILALYSGATDFLPSAGSTSQLVIPAVQFSAAAETVNQSAGTFSITVALSAASNQDVSVPFTLGGSAVSGTDYSVQTASPLTIKAGQTSGTISGTLLADYGQNQTLTFTLGTPTNATLGSTATNTLTITEPQPTIQFSATSEAVNQGAGTFSITVALSAASNQDVSVPFTLGGSAVSGTDYSGVTASPLTIKAGQTSGTITGTLPADPGASPTLTFTLGSPTNATLGSTATNTLTITEPPALKVPGPQTAAENVALAISGVTVGAPQGDSLTVTLSVGHGTLTLTTGLKVTGNGPGSVILAGGADQLNAALKSLMYLPNHDFRGTDKLNISVNDLSLNVSGSVTITVESPAQQAADLEAQVTALQKKGVLNSGLANSLIVKLNLKGNNGDIGKVQAFLSEVNDLLTAGILNPAQAKALSDPGNNLLLSLMRQ